MKQGYPPWGHALIFVHGFVTTCPPQNTHNARNENLKNRGRGRKNKYGKASKAN